MQSYLILKKRCDDFTNVEFHKWSDIFRGMNWSRSVISLTESPETPIQSLGVKFLLLYIVLVFTESGSFLL